MSARVSWSGLDELRAALRQLPADLAAEAGPIVTGAAESARADVVSGYPARTGTLKSKVTVTQVSAGEFGASALIKNRAPHAALFEHGTQARHTALGANRGSMPPGHVFIPAVVRRRRAMYERLKGLLVRAGLKVSGEP